MERVLEKKIGAILEPKQFLCHIDFVISQTLCKILRKSLRKCGKYSARKTDNLKYRHFETMSPMLPINEVNQDFCRPCQCAKINFDSFKGATCD